MESNIADEMMNEADSHFEGVFDTCSEAMNFVDRHAKKEGTDPYGRIWYILKKWIKNDDGAYYDECSYVVADDEIYYAELDNTPNGEKREDSIDYGDGMNLNLPVPFLSLIHIYNISHFSQNSKCNLKNNLNLNADRKATAFMSK